MAKDDSKDQDNEHEPLIPNTAASEHTSQDDPYSTNHGFEIAPGQVYIPEAHDNSVGFSFRKLWAFTGPGFLMSIAYLDPGNIESDLQAGAIAKYKLLWVLMWSTVMGLILQLLSARLANVTGLNLAQICHEEYKTLPRIALWVMMEIAIIGSDIQEVIGSAIAINLLSNKAIPIYGGALITMVDTFTFLFLESAGLRKLEALFGALITTMAAAFLYMYITIAPDQLEILKGLAIPWCVGCDSGAIQQLVGIVGAVIMPHNLYLHSALVLSRRIDHGNRRSVKEANLYYSVESAIALFISFLINLFVVAVFAAAFSDSATYINPSLASAGVWINHKYGLAMKIIWGIGILAAGQSSTMTGTYAGQFVMEGFLKLEWPKWRRVLLTRSLAMGPTIIVALVAAEKLDQMNNWLNVLQSVLLPFALLPVLHFTSKERVMGQFSNSRLVQVVVWCIGLLIMIINGYLVYVYVATQEAWVVAIVCIVMVVYLVFVIYLAMGIERVLKVQIWIYNKLSRNTSHLESEIFDCQQRLYTTHFTETSIGNVVQNTESGDTNIQQMPPECSDYGATQNSYK